MLGGHLGQIGGVAFAAVFEAELDANAVDAHRPVQVVAAILEVQQQRNTHVQPRKFVLGDRFEATVA